MTPPNLRIPSKLLIIDVVALSFKASCQLMFRLSIPWTVSVLMEYLAGEICKIKACLPDAVD